MFDESQLGKLFETAEALGFSECEIYAESCKVVTSRFWGVTDQLHSGLKEGLAFSAVKDAERVRHLVAGTDLGLLSSRLGFQLPLASAKREATSAQPLFEATALLLGTLRSAFASSNEKLENPYAQTSVTERSYCVARPDGPLQKGNDSNAVLRASWTVASDLPVRFHFARARHHARDLMTDLASAEGLASAVKRSLQTAPVWPAPEGEVPVLWSAQCVAKLQALFLKAFDAERVLSNRSFLSHLALPAPFKFSLEDVPPQADFTWDHEGNPVRRMPIFRDGKPTVLACTRQTAQQLEVVPTGHARRGAFDAPTHPSFWSPHVVGDTIQDALLPSMERGVSVRELEVLTFDSVSAETTLRLTHCFLVHQGQEGERMEPLVLRTSLIDLLASFSEFETKVKTTGVLGAQSDFLEITSSASLSKPFPLPGTVPLEHYW